MDYNKYSNQWITKRKSGTHFAHDYLEKPAMMDKLSNLENLDVLVLGCGSGEELEFILKSKPKKIVAVDSSKELIKVAEFNFPTVQFIVSKLEDLEFENQTFDYIFSSLTFHYIKDWISLFNSLNSWLKPRGKILFSTHHPIKWGAKINKNNLFNEFTLGYKKDKKDDTQFQIYGDYLGFNKVQYKLFDKLDIIYYNRPISQMFSEITQNNLQIIDIIEPKPILESAKIKPDFYEVYSKIPLFLILKIQKTK